MANLPLIIGHRGSSAVTPENTIAAFRRSITDGADGIEFDVRLSTDNVPVVIHDATLARTGAFDAPVSSLTVEELQRMDVGKWFYSKAANARASAYDETVPSLEQVFQLFADNSGYLYLEMKGEPVGKQLPKQTARLINEYDFVDRVIVESFDHSALSEIKSVDKRIRCAALFDRRIAKPFSMLRRRDILAAAKAVAAEEIALYHGLVRDDLIHAAISSGFEVVVWTVDDPVWIPRARKLGIKALISNNPAAMLGVRNQGERD